jgi:hypothetical protein
VHRWLSQSWRKVIALSAPLDRLGAPRSFPARSPTPRGSPCRFNQNCGVVFNARPRRTTISGVPCLTPRADAIGERLNRYIQGIDVAHAGSRNPAKAGVTRGRVTCHDGPPAHPNSLISHLTRKDQTEWASLAGPWMKVPAGFYHCRSVELSSFLPMDVSSILWSTSPPEATRHPV